MQIEREVGSECISVWERVRVLVTDDACVRAHLIGRER